MNIRTAASPASYEAASPSGRPAAGMDSVVLIARSVMRKTLSTSQGGNGRTADVMAARSAMAGQGRPAQGARTPVPFWNGRITGALPDGS
ncbi:hypothetical protein FH063_002157 [Azospirillum argentinense]|uniref:Uncharacterized protein n=1 Tax=Azospirillum argentinense TaxID=2970906 RepID=A0A5B0KQS4_9PROT|nr:hypothetical protein FH063_002157 [Azospirillum argentinense]